MNTHEYFYYFLLFSKRDIAKVNFVMHEVHCRRNIILCDKCNEPIPRSETEEHFNEYHAPVKCSQCSESVEVSTLDNHQVTACIIIHPMVLKFDPLKGLKCFQNIISDS